MNIFLSLVLLILFGISLFFAKFVFIDASGLSKTTRMLCCMRVYVKKLWIWWYIYEFVTSSLLDIFMNWIIYGSIFIMIAQNDCNLWKNIQRYLRTKSVEKFLDHATTTIVHSGKEKEDIIAIRRMAFVY